MTGCFRSFSVLVGLSCVVAGADSAAGDAGAEARRLFDLGDYAGAEKAIEKVIETLPAGAAAERAVLLARLAETRVLQGISDAAVQDIRRALELDDSPAVRRSAVFIYLRCQRYREALPLVDGLLAKLPGDASLRLSRGIALARVGDFEQALPDLAAGLELEGARREARFELALALAKLGRSAEALVRLREILEDDPYDAEACYQASRQLLRQRKPDASRLAAVLTRYFEALRDAEGASSRDQHLAFAGKPADAALERAAKWERLGDYAKVLVEAERARSLGAAAAPAIDWLAAFYKRQGFAPDVANDDLARSLAALEIAGDEARTQRAARLLLARDSRSVPALECLAARTNDSSLIVPRLYYVKRLSEVDGRNPRWKSELATLRAALEGGVPPR